MTRRRRPRPRLPAAAAWLLALGAVAIVAVAGCTTVQSFEPEPLVYADRAPIRFAVDRVEVVDGTAAAGGGGGAALGQRVDVPPALAAKALLQGRLQAAGGDGYVRAVITEADLERSELATRTGVTGLFTREPEFALTGRLGVEVEVLAPDGERVGAVSGAASLRRTIQEGASLAEQRKVAYGLVRDLVDELDAGLEANIRENLRRFLVSSPGSA